MNQMVTQLSRVLLFTIVGIIIFQEKLQVDKLSRYMVPLILVNKHLNLVPQGEMLIGAFSGELCGQIGLRVPALVWLATMIFAFKQGYGATWYVGVMLYMALRKLYFDYKDNRVGVLAIFFAAVAGYALYSNTMVQLAYSIFIGEGLMSLWRVAKQAVNITNDWIESRN